MDMTCRDLAEFLMAYLDGELEDGERRVFEQHLQMCPPCVDYLKSYEECVKAGRAACREEELRAGDSVPEALVQAILAARSQKRR